MRKLESDIQRATKKYERAKTEYEKTREAAEKTAEQIRGIFKNSKSE